VAAAPPEPAPKPAAVPPPLKPAPPPESPSKAPPEPESGAPPPADSGAASAEIAQIVATHRPPSAPLFYWPVRGKVLSAYGPAAGGTYNDGINIAAPAGADVAAAESGVVAYAEDKMPGYGNLILIKHADGWVSAYAHNAELLVHKGDHVRRGQAIAKVGESGGVGRPQLHFELRQGVKAVDPLDHLPPLAGDAG
jgi:murein DD-endopeptidase MepM/ murein hydrolase activator NlpD